MSESPNNGQLGHLLSDLRQQSALRKCQRRLALCALLLIVTALALSLTACASPSPPPCEPLPPVTMPVLPRPMPAVSYSLSVQTDLSKWGQTLTSASATTKP